MLDRISAVMVKEVRQLARDRLTFGMIVGIPLMQMNSCPYNNHAFHV